MAAIRSYLAPHKGLRNILSQFLIKAGQTDPGNVQQLDLLKSLGGDMFLLLNDHVHHENEKTLAHLESRVSGASAHDLHEHEELEKVQDSLQEALNKLNSASSAEDMHLFYLQASHFYALYLLHIHHEETVTERLLQENFTDEELMGHHREVIQTIALPTLLLWMKYMVPAAIEKDAMVMLSGIKANAPSHVFETLLDTLREEMHDTCYRSLVSKLG